MNPQLVSEFTCKACFELLYDPLILPCSLVVCKRCLRTSQKYKCPTKDCQRIHYYSYSQTCLLSKILAKIFPQQHLALSTLKQGEHLFKQIPKTPNSSGQVLPQCTETIDYKNLLLQYFAPACELAPNLQLPFITRSKVFAEMGSFKEARYVKYIHLYIRFGCKY